MQSSLGVFNSEADACSVTKAKKEMSRVDGSQRRGSSARDVTRASSKPPVACRVPQLCMRTHCHRASRAVTATCAGGMQRRNKRITTEARICEHSERRCRWRSKRWNCGGECAVQNVEQRGHKDEDVAPAGRGDEWRRRLAALTKFEKMAWFTKYGCAGVRAVAAHSASRLKY